TTRVPSGDCQTCHGSSSVSCCDWSCWKERTVAGVGCWAATCSTTCCCATFASVWARSTIFRAITWPMLGGGGGVVDCTAACPAMRPRLAIGEGEGEGEEGGV